ncbi:MAG: porin family protein [Alphaproteobacteria bacterium]|nr:porin family protein [Alphaproteobacteria bacterium]
MRRLALAVLAAALVTTPALAQDKLNTGWYGALSGSYLLPEDTDGPSNSTLEYDNGFAIYGAAGYRFPNGFRAEAELGYGNIDLDRLRVGTTNAKLNGDVDLFTATGAVYYDFATGSSFSPYVGAGAGVARQKSSTVSATSGGTTVTVNGDSSTDLTAFGEAGVSIRLSSNLDLVPAYRYQWIDDGEGGFDDTTAHVFKVGLRYWF